MTNKHFHLDLDTDGVLIATFDSPGVSMNVLGEEVFNEIRAIAERAKTDDAVKGVVLTSGKDSFCAGMNLEELTDILRQASGPVTDDLKRQLFEGVFDANMIYRELETCGKPVAAALNGLALGGAYELAMACHYRVLSDHSSAQVGLPEAMIGLFPGIGGSQRLPRMIGVMAAGPLMLQGKTLRPADALQQGLVNELVPASDVVAKAKAWVLANPEAKQPWDQDGYRLPGGGPYHPAGGQTFAAASPMVRRDTFGVFPAQRLLLSAIYEGVQLPFDTALKVESRYFTKLLLQPECGAMVNTIFLSKQALEKGGRRPADQQKQDVRKIGVIGAGFMGAGIANVSVNNGIEVVLIDVDQAGADRGKAHIEKDLKKRVERGRMTQEKADAILARITATTDYNALSDVDMVVEAVFEDREIKRKVFEQLEAAMPADAILASNTSTIPITELAAMTKDPERFVGVHFFSPVERMLLVELITGEKTSNRAVSRAIDLVTTIKKTPILVRDAWAFYANRCVMRYLEQGMAMLAEGYSPALIENGAKMAGMKVPPLSLQDEVAIDLGVKILKSRQENDGDAYQPGATDDIIVSMVDTHGRLGRKNKKGFYDYPDEGAKRLWPELSQYAKNGVLESQPEWTEVRDRVLYAQALEAARTMEMGVVEDPREADVGSILGWAFAPYSGGAISFIDKIVGPAAFLKRAEELHAAYGEPFSVPEILRDIVAKGDTFYGRFGGAA